MSCPSISIRLRRMSSAFPSLLLLALAACGDDGSGTTTDVGASTGASTTDASTGVDATTGGPGGSTTAGPTTDTASTGPTTTDATTATTTTDATTDATTTSASTGGSTTGGALFHVSGKIEYERVPYDVDAKKLDYAATAAMPVRGASVRLIDADNDVELASTVTDDQGGYAFDYDGAAKVKLWVFAETTTPPITVEDNTDGDTIYVIESAAVDSGGNAALDVLAKTGWTGESYGEPRLAAPFAVLDSVYTATRRFLDETTPAPDFVPLHVNWSPNNRPEPGDKAAGQIGTSHWDKEELYILGKEDVDTDEFDDHIIVHEWCHSFQSTVTRDDTIGGNHAEGDVIDPRVAWSEGSCNAMSAIILDPAFLYSDTFGLKQADSYEIALDTNIKDAAANPGWFSERVVAGIVLDLYDNTAEPFDKTSLGLQGIYDGLLAQKALPSLTTLFSFIAPLKAAHPQDAAAIDALVVYHTADAALGISTIKDQWATGETHAGDTPLNLPLYTIATIDKMVTRQLIGGEPDNHAAQNRYFRIVGDGLPIVATSTCDGDIDLAVYAKGKKLATAETNSGNEQLMFDTVDKEIYVLTVHGYNDLPGPYSATISLTH